MKGRNLYKLTCKMVFFIQANEGKSDFLYKSRVTIVKDEEEKEGTYI